MPHRRHVLGVRFFSPAKMPIPSLKAGKVLGITGCYLIRLRF